MKSREREKNEHINSELSSAELISTIAVSNVLGEGVIYRRESDSIWWTDIKSNRIYKYCLSVHELAYWITPYPVCSFGFTDDEMTLLVAFDRGIAIYNLLTQNLDWLVRPEADYSGNRLNDGKTDAMGRFWVGSMIENGSLNPAGVSGSLYCIDDQAVCHRRLTDILISNGLCWSPDNQYLYHADSPRHSIYRYRFNLATAEVSHKTLFVKTPENYFPDGSTVDKEGFLWNAQWGGSRVVRYSPDGEENLVIELPVTQPTCVALGGKKGDLLFVTSARDELTPEQLSNQPQAGNLFIYKVTALSVDEPFCKLTNI